MIKKPQIDLLLQALKLGLTVSDACVHSGIHRVTFYKRIKQNAAFAQQVEQATLYPKMRAIVIVQKAAESSWQAAAWLLERRWSDDFALKNKTEVSGKDGSPLVIEMVDYSKKVNSAKA